MTNKTFAELADEYDAEIEVLLKLQRRDRVRAKAGDRNAMRALKYREEQITDAREIAARLRHYYD